ncbi:MAG: AAA family ATPase [Pirellulales bacterium]
MSVLPADSVVEAFRSALWSCRQLYLTAAQESERFHGDAVRGTSGDFTESMLELSRGLALKIFVTVAQADWHWSSTERALAEELFDFVWGERLRGGNLKEALMHVIEQAHKLRWGNLLRPFETLPPFAQRSRDLVAAALRLANIVAKADGAVNDDEIKLISHIRLELERVLLPISLDWSIAPRAAGESVAHAVQATQATSQQIRPLPLAGQPLPSASSSKPPTIWQAAPLQRQVATHAGAAGPVVSREEQLAEALAELDQLIGIANIKQDVRELINFLRMQTERTRLGMPTTPVSLHMVFRGNPGTGKTTVARILGRVLGGMGILQKGHLVECDRSGLVAEYAGQTGPKTNRMVDAALDGVLFIDEAYSLISRRGDDPFGAEAVQTLLKRMEDDRQRLVVILAGYSQPIDALLETNPGLKSRFSRSFTFGDYSILELCRIFARVCEVNHYELNSAARAKLLIGFQRLLADKDEHFGNARTARNIFEQAIRRLANRIAPIVPVTRELLSTIEAEDLLLPIDTAAAPTSSPPPEGQRFLIACPDCGHASRNSQKILGRRVRCKPCGSDFVADWGEPVE